MKKPRRNDDCPCGSGKKFKRCHGQSAVAAAAQGLGPAMPSAVDTGQVVGFLNSGRFAEAEAAAHSLVVRFPALGFGWKMRGIAELMQGKDAIKSLQQAALLSPGDPDVHCNLGNVLHRAGRLQEAADSCQRALAIQPTMVEALNNLANILVDARQYADAIGLYRRAIALHPAYGDALSNLANALHRTGDQAGAIEAGRQALAARATPDAHTHIGNAQRALGDAAAARESYLAALALDPRYVVALVNLASLLRDEGGLAEARELCLRALQASPNYANAYLQLGLVLLDLGDGTDAVESFRRTLVLRPADVSAAVGLALALRAIGRFDDARQCAEKALAVAPAHAPALVAVANLAADRGDFAAADAAFGKALEADPDSVEALVGIARYGLAAPDAAWLERARRLQGHALAVRDRVSLEYAIGACLDRADDLDGARSAFAAAHAAASRYGLVYDEAAATAVTDGLIASFTADVVGRRLDGANESEVPVFIVGMPRAGASLLEQMLASHPSVFGAGEANYWSAGAAAYRSTVAAGESGDEFLARCGDKYAKALAELHSTALRVTDRAPANYLHLGLIHLALPRARFIHLTRDPVDTGWSIYTHDFSSTLPYAGSLASIAHQYREYRRLMAHWQAVLPAATVLELPYESLVAEPEAAMRRVLAFLGLEWNAACLEFQATPRQVLTEAKRAVRQPLTTAAVGRARRYGEALAAFGSLAAPA